MKRPGVLIIIVCFLLYCGNSYIHAQESPGTDPWPAKSLVFLDYQFARWYQFKTAALTLTFDDGYRNQFVKALPLLNERNIRSSFYIVTSRVGNGPTPGWDTLRAAAIQGHEIGSHTMHHADLSFLTSVPAYADSLRRELQDSRDIIDQHIPEQRCETLAWPFGQVNNLAIWEAEKYYMTCRGSNNQTEGPVPKNYFNVSSRYIYHDTPLEVCNAYVYNVLFTHGWLVERLHQIDTGYYEPIPLPLLTAHLDYIKANEQGLWIAPLNLVIKYIRERECAHLDLLDFTNGCFRFALTDTLDDAVYDLPLSIELRLDGSLIYVNWIMQQDKQLQYSIITRNNGTFVRFEAIPDKGDIRMNIPVEFFQNYPNPFVSKTGIFFELTSPQEVRINVYNDLGTLVKSCEGFYQFGKNSVEFDGSLLPGGMYIARIEAGSRKYMIRMILVK
jgi:peptidoglycan/xylan/chitin deacetylase (PgdA/CDA1 family)